MPKLHQKIASKSAIAFSKLFIYLSYLLILVGIIFLFYRTYFYFIASEASGIIEELVTNGYGEQQTLSPKFSFTDSNGQNYIVTSKESSSFISLKVGEKVNILYHPENPLNAIINSFTTLWLGPFFVIIGGIVFHIFGRIFYFIFSRIPVHHWKLGSNF